MNHKAGLVARGIVGVGNPVGGGHHKEAAVGRLGAAFVATGKNRILARNFSLSQGNKDKSCPGQEIRETRTRFQSWRTSPNPLKIHETV